MAEILSGFALMLHSVMMYPGTSPGDSQGAFFWVQLDVESPEVAEGFFQIGDEAATLFGLYHNVIDVNLMVIPYLLFEAKLHTLLICSPHVLLSERHFYVAKIGERSDEYGGRLVRLSEGYLVTAQVGILKAQELTSSSEIYDLVYVRKRK
jgi:hypothetical protein